jgi:ribosomal protein L31E
MTINQRRAAAMVIALRRAERAVRIVLRDAQRR